jgi:hypothetical protein
MRNFLNVIADILTLLAIVIAGIGHMLPWLDARYPYDNPVNLEPFKQVQGQNWQEQDRLQRAWDAKATKAREERDRARAVDYMSFQAWHASRSGIALGVLTVLVFLSLAFTWPPTMRRILVLLMFGAALTALIFETLIFTQYPITEQHVSYAGRLHPDGGFVTAVVGTSLAVFFSLIRMLWTMPPVRAKSDEPPSSAHAVPVARPSPEPGPSFGAQRDLNH